MHGLAGPAHMQLRTQGRGAASEDGPQQPPLPEVQDVVRHQRLVMAPEDIRDAQDGPLRWVAVSATDQGGGRSSMGSTLPLIRCVATCR